MIVLALQVGGGPATRDDALIAASRRRGVTVHDLRDPE